MVVDGDRRRVGAVAEWFQPRQQAVMPAKGLADAVPDALANDTVGVVDVARHRAHLALDSETDDGVAPPQDGIGRSGAVSGKADGVVVVVQAEQADIVGGIQCSQCDVATGPGKRESEVV
jgi:hypothetical protein